MDSRIGSQDFSQRKQTIQDFFKELAEKKQKEQRLKQTVAEFFHVQATFHEKTRGFVNGLDAIKDSLPDDESELVKSYMQPYVVLTGNPFWTEPTGDLQKDLEHIFSVISKRNDHLSLIFASTMFCAANLSKFHDLLGKIGLDARMAQIMKEAVKTPQWQIVESCIVFPYQNACRYKLLLNEIEKQLQNTNSNHVHVLLDNIRDAIDNLKFELEHLNDHKDTLQELNEVDYLLVRLLEMDSVLNCSYQSETGLSVELLLTQARVYIAGIKRKIVESDIDYIDQLGGTLALLKLVRPALEVSIQEENNSYYKSAYDFLERVADAIAPPPEALRDLQLDPRYLLIGKIDDLTSRLEHLAKNELHALHYNREVIGIIDTLDESLFRLRLLPVMQQSQYKSEHNLSVTELIAQARRYVIAVKAQYAAANDKAEEFLVTLSDLIAPIKDAVEQSLQAERNSYYAAGVTYVKETLFGASDQDVRKKFLTNLAHLDARANLLRPDMDMDQHRPGN